MAKFGQRKYVGRPSFRPSFEVAIAACALVGANLALGEMSHEDYMNKFGKSYSEAEIGQRRATYMQRLAIIERQNEDSSRLWTAGVNEYTDWYDHELSMLAGYRRQAGGDGSSGFGVGAVSLVAMGDGEGEPTASDDIGTLPDRLDWREHYPTVISPVKSQGSCGSCWAFTAVEELESFAAMASGRLMELSPQSINSCSPNPLECGGSGGCMGSTPQLGWNWTMTNGVPSIWAVPYTSGLMATTGNCSIDMVYQSEVRNLGFVTIPVNQKAQMMRALVEVGPLGVIVASGSWWQYMSGIFDACNASENVLVDHAVQLVGYGQEQETKYWLVRNSWGAKFGENGYIRLKRYNEEPCGWDYSPQSGSGCNGGPAKVWVCGECGILYEPSYPTGVHFIGEARRLEAQDETSGSIHV
mmetsp:Transcript_15555/g.33789  ORF Transcript_15555/g.33789 Transcript_15555/m.33789 type:complete len:413 (-) Transcript_15555:533-1771(-)|eukprot:CAMPEP_0206448660 /NCGR_PEP_ID=MMETSP0324_2-20121206/17607_1 /ASSEMBLY_ACC=CAM_ASM_000836 /TAXON_ID=2866 /ORGANISM="Crypthecodinium cohnii, Strain Seligo" /LENGTH=412 /DNA_ID=CAMNT_0053917851 /DNA_START=54 /DNA_END=1292 /DNA_ORIENTATION=+